MDKEIPFKHPDKRRETIDHTVVLHRVFESTSASPKIPIHELFAVCLIAVINEGIKLTSRKRREYNHTK
ncbi:MAG: hypothetical protein PUG45_06660 [bacterium]|nr:hypothetical protein [bacterium]